MGQYSQLLFVLVLVAVFWFVAIRPQQQRAKQQKAMLAALKPGDEIVTIGGLFATVVDAGERILVRVADGSTLEFSPQAISRVLTSSESSRNEPVGDESVDNADDKAELDA